ncbi:MAG: DsrE family protein [Alteromonadaceae bacterium]|nr:DsrE family protein [Alteromonadaceae bacterium]
MRFVRKTMLLLLLCFVSFLNLAASFNFEAGPVFSDYGKHASVPGIKFDKSAKFKVAFDVASGTDAGTINRKFDSLARFTNMHVANGVPLQNIQLALVVHGQATLDILNNTAYQNRKNATNQNIPLLQALMQNGVRVIVCGQSAAAHKVTPDMLTEGSEVALSAMTAHALLQQDGYTLNPF